MANLYCIKDGCQNVFYVVAEDEENALHKYDCHVVTGALEPVEHRTAEFATLFAVTSSLEKPWGDFIP